MARVLIVDDSSAVRAYHASILLGQGHQVDLADNGYEGLEKFCAVDYDLVLVDINMPRMHGYDLVREIRKNERGKKVGIVVVSTEAGSNDRFQAYKAGADLYLVKPVRPEELERVCVMFSRAKGGSNHDGGA
ncbi:MAG: two-component system, chemotaxis family, chemotaxis protein CheY [Clostridia bacterium]|nr:two-component system, chemotaxis family, chemotaxis protein CheY [Clostridia bacterium]